MEGTAKPATPITFSNRSYQYDGTNSAAIAAEGSVVILSETGGVLTMESPLGSTVWNIPLSYYIVFAENYVVEVSSPADFTRRWRCVALCDSLAPAVGTPLRSVGVAPVPLLLASASTTVAVQLNPAMPDATYTPQAFLFAGISIVGLQINSVSVVDADTVNVVVQNVGLLSLQGSNVLVTAQD